MGHSHAMWPIGIEPRPRVGHGDTPESRSVGAIFWWEVEIIQKPSTCSTNIKITGLTETCQLVMLRHRKKARKE